jgi:hypothetical protein
VLSLAEHLIYPTDALTAQLPAGYILLEWF